MGNDLILTWSEYISDINHLIVDLRNSKLITESTALVALTRGGLIPAQMVAHAFNIHASGLYAWQVSVYDVEHKPLQNMYIGPLPVIHGKYNRLFVIDDLVENGAVLKHAINVLGRLQKFSTNVFSAAVYEYGTNTLQRPHFSARILQGGWVTFPYDVNR